MNRRFANGFTANGALSFNNTRSNRTVEEFDREPTLWLDDNNSRPYRVSGGVGLRAAVRSRQAVAAEGRRSGRLPAAGRSASTFEYQPGSLIQFNTNLFYYGNIDDIKKSNPEIALNANGTIDANKYWFNIENFERDNARTPTSFQTRAFPFQIDGLRGPGLTYTNLNVSRTIKLGGRAHVPGASRRPEPVQLRRLQQPDTDPTNTNFGRVTTAVASAGAMRFFSVGARFTF